MNVATPTVRSRDERDRLVEQYLPLVRYVVARLPLRLPSAVGREDFYSVGVIGLLHAATAWDPNRGASFKTFAYTAIKGAILDEVRRQDPVSRGLRQRLRKLDQATVELRSQLDRAPTLEEIAERLQIASDVLDDDLLGLHTFKMLSLDDHNAAHGDQPETLASLIASKTTPDPGDETARLEASERLAKAISELPEVERNVVVLYHWEELYLKEIGDILGVTESRVCQILSRATARLSVKLKEKLG